MDPIDLDGFATTPLAPEARAAMMEAWNSAGNPGSAHAAGERAAALVEAGRASVARLLGAAPSEIVITSGATEANNLAITGTALGALAGGSHRRGIIVSAVEHKAVLAPAVRLRQLGFDVRIAPVRRDGTVDLDALADAVGPDTLLVSVMAANNETGVLQPLEEVAALGHTAGALVHCDAAQAVGKMPVDVVDLDVDYLSVSGHKMHGPTGVGALYLAAGSPRPAPLVVGGEQESGLRAGTVAAPLVAGFGAAADAAAERMDATAARRAAALSKLLDQLSRRGVEFSITTGGSQRLPGATSLLLGQVDAEEIVSLLSREVLLSTGSACTSGQVSPSHVLTAIGLSRAESSRVLRLYCGSGMSDKDAATAADLIANATERARSTGQVCQ